MFKSQISLHSCDGQRKYLNKIERKQFLKATEGQPLGARLFCQLLYHTGARIAEIHNFTSDNIDVSNGTVLIETLKKRRKGIYREILPPKKLLIELHDYARKRQLYSQNRLWPFSLRTASRYVKAVMHEANIKGSRSSARGLRHGYAVNAATITPLPLVKKWLGHSELETTEIYLNIMGEEEREYARKLLALDGAEEIKEEEMKNEQSIHSQLHGLEDELIQMKGLVKALQKVQFDDSASTCVANAIEDRLEVFQEQFYGYWKNVGRYH